MTSLCKVLEKHKKFPQESLPGYYSKAYEFCGSHLLHPILHLPAFLIAGYDIMFDVLQEFSLKKRIQTKELQQQALNDLKEKTEMPEEQAAWLMKEHAKNVSALDRIHDEELSRQRLVLEEKLAQRRALAELSVCAAYFHR